MIYLFFAIIIVGLLLNMVWEKYALYGITYQRSLDRTLVEIDESFRIHIVIENDKPLPLTFFQVRELLPEYVHILDKEGKVIRGSSTFTMMMLPRERVRRTYEARAMKRGRYLFHDVRLSAGDLLGLQVMSSEVSLIQELVVLPKRLEIPAFYDLKGDYYGDISVRRWIAEDPVLTMGFREYTGREPMKSINWLASMRNGNLIVNSYDYTTDNKVFILLNTETSRPFWVDIKKDLIENSVETTRFLAEEFDREGIPYGFDTNASMVGLEGSMERILPGTGTGHLSVVLESLGRVDYTVNVKFESLLWDVVSDFDEYKTIVVVTPRVIEEHVAALLDARRKVMNLIVVTEAVPEFDLPGIEVLVREGGEENAQIPS
ncbi:MAG TPA: DUF58 domain-containing protein [Clostridiaceae bacterium]|nr:DUF58 domain-containing protein [Clostridiaceae bacterium]